MSSDGPSPRGRRPIPQVVRTGDPQGLGAVLDRMLRERPWRGGLRLGEVARMWSEIVGERLATVSEPAALDDGALLVRVSSAAWAVQIRFLGEELRRRTNQVLGQEAVRSVQVIVGERRGG